MASKFIIHGGVPLNGRVRTSGSKNSALPILAASALAADGETILENVPGYTDIHDMCQILRELGATVEWLGESTVRIVAADLSHHIAPYHLARKLRGSTYIMGLLIARLGRGEVAFPGGCDIGARPVDFHLKGFKALGADVVVERGAMVVNSCRLQGGRFFIDRSSFGTTVNLMITSALTPGTTVLENAACEPEIVDLAQFLSSMGARLRGAGTNTIRVEGVSRLKGARHEIIPDRLEVGTYLMAAAMTGGDVTVENCVPEHLRTVTAKLQEAGQTVEPGLDSVRLKAGRIIAADVETQPYPGFPTDLQSPWVSLMTVCSGVSIVNETIFENRFGFVNELQRLGASIKVDHNTAIVRGVPRLTGAQIEAKELRGGVALVLGGLAAEGITEVTGIKYVDRGYEHLETKLQALGVRIKREAVFES